MAEEALENAADRAGEAQRRICHGEAETILVIIRARTMVEL